MDFLQRVSSVNKNSAWWGRAVALVGVVGLTTLTGQPGLAAEKINLVLGSGNTNGILVPIADLRTYAATQKVSPQLETLLTLTTPEQQADLLKTLKATYTVNSANLQQVLDSGDGQKILTQAAAATLRPDANGIAALRTALMASATSPQGFGALTFLESYPDPVMNIDLLQAQNLFSLNQQLFDSLQQQVTTPSAAPGTTNPGTISPGTTSPGVSPAPANPTPSSPATPPGQIPSRQGT